MFCSGMRSWKSNIFEDLGCLLQNDVCNMICREFVGSKLVRQSQVMLYIHDLTFNHQIRKEVDLQPFDSDIYIYVYIYPLCDLHQSPNTPRTCPVNQLGCANSTFEGECSWSTASTYAQHLSGVWYLQAKPCKDRW